jgi:hypothetical protein
MTFNLTYKASDSPDFDWLADELQQPEPMLRAFAAYRQSQFRQTVALGTDPYGVAYAPLSAMYAKQKARRYGNKAILSATGAMLRSYRVTVSGRSIEETVSADYAGYHQSGTSKMPKRAILPDERGLPAKDQQKLIELTSKYIDQQVGRMPRI